MNPYRPFEQERKKPVDKMFWGLLISFCIFVCLTAYLAFSLVKETVSSLGFGSQSSEIQKPEIQPVDDQEKFLDVSNPLQGEHAPPPLPWDGKSRVTLLLLGVDSRDWLPGNGPPLTDTIILATIDPGTQTAAMLSFPRDLWVEIPNYGPHKINQAYQLGEANGESEGGAGLAMETLESFFGIPIQYYALVDFNAFVRLVDEINGVKIDVPEAIKIDPVGEKPPVVLQPGVQTLTGELALAYVRNRDTAGSDFDRIQRQQQVILAIRKRVISFEMIQILMDKAPLLYREVASGVKTNLSMQQAVQLAFLAAQIPEGNIRSFHISHEQVIDMISWDGMLILQPIPEAILSLRDSFLASEPVPTSEVVLEMDLEQRVQEENARVTIRNGTYTPGLAASTSEYLQSLGIQVVDVANADQVYDQTTIIDYTGKPYTLEYLAKLLNISPGKIYQRFEPDSSVDITIILGEDWAENNTLP
jgi:LCP family protein required for cell wall assembly